jgi:hypothetical protein
MSRLNREKFCAALAFIIFLLGVYSFVRVQTARYEEIPVLLAPYDQELPPIEPVVHVEALGGTRNPFHLSSEWKPVEPEALALPPPEPDPELRVLFGWPAERAPGAPLHYRAARPVERKDDGAAEPAAGTGGASGAAPPGEGASS